MPLETVAIPVTTAGADGSATGSASSGLLGGFILAIFADFHADAPATTDTTIAYGTRGGTILALTDTKTDALHVPQRQASDAAGAAIAGAYGYFPIHDKLTVSVAQCNALAPAVTVYVTLLREL